MENSETGAALAFLQVTGRIRPETWSRERDSNSRPSLYKSAALTD